MLLSLFLFFTCLPINIILLYGLPKVMLYIRRYNSLSTIMMLSLLSLSGLPPLSFFFLKFNMLIYLSSNITGINLLLVFLFFLLNTFFYLQLFYHTNIAVSNIDILKRHNKQKRFNNQNITFFNSLCLIVFILFFFYFFIFFFLDFFFITYSYLI